MCGYILHLGGNFTVGVSVVAVNGEFAKQYYKKYRIKSAENDDFQSMSELFSRKGENIREGSDDEADLYIIDGGTGQLNSAMKAAEKCRHYCTLLYQSAKAGHFAHKNMILKILLSRYIFQTEKILLLCVKMTRFYILFKG